MGLDGGVRAVPGLSYMVYHNGYPFPTAKPRKR